MKRYCILQLKRMATYIPYMFVYVLLILAGSICVFGLLQKKDANGEELQRIPIGIVGNMEETYFNIAFTALERLDSVSHTLSMQRMEKDEAARALKKGKIAAYVVIPDGVVQSVLVGKNKQIVFVTADVSYSLGNQIIEELTEVISNLLVETQNAIYGMQQLAEETKVTYDRGEAVEALNLQYVELVLTRPDLFELEYVSGQHPFSLKTYYGCAFMVMILSFLGMGCVMFAVKRERSFVAFFRVHGGHPFVLVLGEYVAYFVWLFGGACMIVAFCLVSGMISGNGVLLLVAAIPVVVALAAVQFLLYEWSDSVISAVLWQFIIAVCFCYLSGCFYPTAFFPEVVQNIAKYLPQGAALQYLLSYQRKTGYGEELFILLFYSVSCLAVTVAVRMRNSR